MNKEQLRGYARLAGCEVHFWNAPCPFPAANKVQHIKNYEQARTAFAARPGDWNVFFMKGNAEIWPCP